MSTVLTVTDMSCNGCEATVEAAVEDVSGVTSVEADRENETVTVEGTADVDALVAAVEGAGYEASA